MKKVKNKYLKTQSQGDYKIGVAGPISSSCSDIKDVYWPFDDSKKVKREIDRIQEN